MAKQEIIIRILQPLPFGCSAKSESRGTERTDRRRMTRSTFSIQEVGSETEILDGKTRVQEESTDENAALHTGQPGHEILACRSDSRFEIFRSNHETTRALRIGDVTLFMLRWYSRLKYDEAHRVGRIGDLKSFNFR